MGNKQAEWAARLICNSDRQEIVDVISADRVVVHEVDIDGDVVTTIATTVTTEPELLQALINQIRKEHKDAKEN